MRVTESTIALCCLKWTKQIAQRNTLLGTYTLATVIHWIVLSTPLKIFGKFVMPMGVWRKCELHCRLMQLIRLLRLIYFFTCYDAFSCYVHFTVQLIYNIYCKGVFLHWWALHSILLYSIIFVIIKPRFTNGPPKIELAYCSFSCSMASVISSPDEFHWCQHHRCGFHRLFHRF